MPPKKEEITKRIKEYFKPAVSGMASFGIKVPEGPNTYDLTHGRGALSTLAVGEMLRQGRSFDQIQDPDSLHQDRLDAGEKVVKMYSGDQEAFGRYAAETYTEVIEKGLTYLENHVSMGMDAIDLLKPENRYDTVTVYEFGLF